MTPCPPVERLELLLADQLPEPENDTLAEHVEACDRCQERLEQLTHARPLSGDASSPPPRRIRIRDRHRLSWTGYNRRRRPCLPKVGDSATRSTAEAR